MKKIIIINFVFIVYVALNRTNVYYRTLALLCEIENGINRKQSTGAAHAIGGYISTVQRLLDPIFIYLIALSHVSKK